MYWPHLTRGASAVGSTLPRFCVVYGYRTDDGMACSLPTARDQVTVEAFDAVQARQMAIDAAYQKHGPNCSHVTILSVTFLEPERADDVDEPRGD